MADPHLRQALAPLAEQFRVQLIPPGEDTSEPQIFAELDPDAKGRPRRLELVFLPHGDNLFYLQYFVLLPFSLEPARTADLARLLARINLRVPLVGFGMSEDDGWVFFRAIAPCPRQELDPEVVVSTAYMAYYLVEQIADVIEPVAAGDGALEDAFAAFDVVLAGQPEMPSSGE